MSNPVNERFLEAFSFLRDRGTVTSQKELAQALEFPESHFTGYRSGARKIGLQQVAKLHIKFGVSLTYMVIGRGPIMEQEARREKEEQALERQLAVEKAKVALLERERAQLLRDLDYYKELLRDRLAK